MRRTLVAACFALSCFPVLAHAVSFTFSLTPVTPGGQAGFGSFDIASSVTPDTVNYFYYGSAYPPSTNTLTQLTFSIGGETFQASDDSGISEVSFTSGSLAAISYVGDVKAADETYALLVHDLSYTFGEDTAGAPYTTGKIVDISSTVIPEPSSFALLGTGILSILSAARRRSSPESQV